MSNSIMLFACTSLVTASLDNAAGNVSWNQKNRLDYSQDLFLRVWTVDAVGNDIELRDQPLPQ